jgi:hypothetical protein
MSYEGQIKDSWQIYYWSSWAMNCGTVLESAMNADFPAVRIASMPVFHYYSDADAGRVLPFSCLFQFGEQTARIKVERAPSPRVKRRMSLRVFPWCFATRSRGYCHACRCRARSMKPTQSMPQSTHSASAFSLDPIARLPGLRVLAWSGNQLYAARRYELLCLRIVDASCPKWDCIAEFRPELKRRLTICNRITARLFRDGFHALAVLPGGCLVAVVAGAIISLRTGEREFSAMYRVTRGARPLHITAVPNGSVFWGEYFDNASRDEVHVYGSRDGEGWEVAYTFSKGAIRHVHNIVYDRWENCLWVLTGDYGDECRILRAECDFSRIETVLKGNQQARAVGLVPMQDGLYFASDTPLEPNFLYRLDRSRNLSRLVQISSSSIYGCQVGDHVFFSTMVEPSKVNRDHHVRLYGGHVSSPQWQSLLEWQKDSWPMGLFQYGNAFLPDGNNTTAYLALTTVAVKTDDQVTSIYKVQS